MKWIPFAVVAGLVLLYAVAGLSWSSPLYSPLALVSGTAHRPFAYRVLTPVIMQMLIALGMPITHAAVLLSAAMLAVFVVSLRWLAHGLGQTIGHGQWIAAVAGLLVLQLTLTQIYDLPTLALWTAALAALANRRRALYLAVFAAACLNRETTFLLIAIDALAFGVSRSTTAQIAIYVITHGVLMFAMSGRPGTDAEFHFADHLAQTGASIERLTLYALAFTLAACLVARRFQRKPWLLRAAVLITVPALGLAYFVVGYPFEFRIFYEAYPAVALLALWPVKT